MLSFTGASSFGLRNVVLYCIISVHVDWTFYIFRFPGRFVNIVFSLGGIRAILFQDAIPGKNSSGRVPTLPHRVINIIVSSPLDTKEIYEINTVFFMSFERIRK